jgi:hypothetical protein
MRDVSARMMSQNMQSAGSYAKAFVDREELPVCVAPAPVVRGFVTALGIR